MKDHPILFSAPMIRALLEGRKTQTRRVVKAAKDRDFGCMLKPNEIAAEVNDRRYRNSKYGAPGDLLWVRETASRSDKSDDGFFYEFPIYRADITDPHGLAFVTDDGPRYVEQLKWRSSIHMPREWSRLTLRITDVRVQRLQDISEADAIAEGVERDSDGWFDYLMPGTQCCVNARQSFETLWQSINGPGSWGANPWVWALKFDVIQKNIDAARGES